jgi:hypothetical protein
MFTEVKCYTLNTDHIVYIDKDDRGWTIHLSNGETLVVESAWIADLKSLLERPSDGSALPDRLVRRAQESDLATRGFTSI